MATTRYLGVDLGATNTKMVVVAIPDGGEPEIVSVDSVRTGGEDGHDAVLERLIAVFLAKGETEGPFAAFGMGTPGLSDAEGVVEIFTNLPGQWRGLRLRDRLEAGLDMPVTLINDARAFTLAEGRIGAGKGAPIVVCMTLGTGIGGGIMIDGELFVGATGIAGEIAHQTVLPDGPGGISLITIAIRGGFRGLAPRCENTVKLVSFATGADPQNAVISASPNLPARTPRWQTKTTKTVRTTTTRRAILQRLKVAAEAEEMKGARVPSA